MSIISTKSLNNRRVITTPISKVGKLSVAKLTLVLQAGFKNLMINKNHWLSQKTFPLLEAHCRVLAVRLWGKHDKSMILHIN